MRSVLVMLGLLLSFNASAAGSVSAKVLLVRIDRGGQGMIVFDQPIGGTPPTCVVPAYSNAFAFDANTAGGRAIMAMALAAKASGSQVDAQGLGACPTYAGLYIEDISYGVSH